MDQPQFLLTRNWDNLTRDNMISEINNNQLMSSIFTLQSTDKIWNNLLTGINIVINTLAPSKVIQLKANYVPYLNNEINEAIEASNEQLSVAIRSGAVEEWRTFRSLRNTATKVINFFKGEYYTIMLTKMKTMWRTVKLITNEDASTLPR